MLRWARRRRYVTALLVLSYPYCFCGGCSMIPRFHVMEAYSTTSPCTILSYPIRPVSVVSPHHLTSHPTSNLSPYHHHSTVTFHLYLIYSPFPSEGIPNLHIETRTNTRVTEIPRTRPLPLAPRGDKEFGAGAERDQKQGQGGKT